MPTKALCKSRPLAAERVADRAQQRVDVGSGSAEPDAGADSAGNRDVLAAFGLVPQPGGVPALDAEQVGDERMRAERSSANGDCLDSPGGVAEPCAVQPSAVNATTPTRSGASVH